MSRLQPRLTKQQKRQIRIEQRESRNKLKLVDIIPLTSNQRRAFNSYYEDKNLFLHGIAGTGKTFISSYLAIKDVEREYYDKLIFYRSAVPSRDMGFMPGNIKEKTRLYEAPYYAIFQRLYGRGDAYEILTQKELVEFESTSYVRGITIEDAVVIVDEVQNLSPQELNSLITRIGENCRVVFCGDIRQTDLTKRHDPTGLIDFYKIVQGMSCFDVVEFGAEDIIRSSLVKEYIQTRMRLEDEGKISAISHYA